MLRIISQTSANSTFWNNRSSTMLRRGAQAEWFLLDSIRLVPLFQNVNFCKYFRKTLPVNICSFPVCGHHIRSGAEVTYSRKFQNFQNSKQMQFNCCHVFIALIEQKSKI